jgi:hypothetical protein
MFKRLIDKLLCCHEWMTFSEVKMYGNSNEYPTQIKYTLICKKCGKIKQITNKL